MSTAPVRAHCARAVLMVAPHDFEFNEETSADNEFQNRPTVSVDEINKRAMGEFEAMVQTLRGCGVTVVIPERRREGQKTPDAVFPNNWFVTEHDGTVLLFPMAPPCRRLEKRPEAVERALIEAGFVVRNVVNIGRWEESEHFLEGTGTLVFDHLRRVAYAAQSERCHPEQLINFASLRGYETVCFQTASSSGRPIYHTNVMMSLGERFAVVAPASIPSAAQRAHVMAQVAVGREVIEIEPEQVEQHMCGNILQIRSRAGESLIVMSQRAHDGFTAHQRLRLTQHGQLTPIPLPTIEHVGGGSARCMLAEVFLPHRTQRQPAASS